MLGVIFGVVVVEELVDVDVFVVVVVVFFDTRMDFLGTAEVVVVVVVVVVDGVETEVVVASVVVFVVAVFLERAEMGVVFVATLVAVVDVAAVVAVAVLADAPNFFVVVVVVVAAAAVLIVADEAAVVAAAGEEPTISAIFSLGFFHLGFDVFSTLATGSGSASCFAESCFCFIISMKESCCLGGAFFSVDVAVSSPGVAAPLVDVVVVDDADDAVGIATDSGVLLLAVFLTGVFSGGGAADEFDENIEMRFIKSLEGLTRIFPAPGGEVGDVSSLLEGEEDFSEDTEESDAVEDDVVIVDAVVVAVVAAFVVAVVVTVVVVATVVSAGFAIEAVVIVVGLATDAGDAAIDFLSATVVVDGVVVAMAAVAAVVATAAAGATDASCFFTGDVFGDVFGAVFGPVLVVVVVVAVVAIVAVVVVVEDGVVIIEAVAFAVDVVDVTEAVDEIGAPTV